MIVAHPPSAARGHIHGRRAMNQDSARHRVSFHHDRHPCSTARSLLTSVSQDGYAFVRGEGMRDILTPFGSLADWQMFADSWEALEIDPYMADGGRYRQRRHAVYAAEPTGAIRREPHQPHYQSLDYNPLHGGIERWFAPIVDEIGDSQTLATVLACCRSLFGELAPGTPSWRIEVHQFRIEARSGGIGTADARRAAPRRGRLCAGPARQPAQHRQRRDRHSSVRWRGARIVHAHRAARRGNRRRPPRRTRSDAGRTDRSGGAGVSRCAGGDVRGGKIGGERTRRRSTFWRLGSQRRVNEPERSERRAERRTTPVDTTPPA